MPDVIFSERDYRELQLISCRERERGRERLEQEDDTVSFSVRTAISIGMDVT